MDVQEIMERIEYLEDVVEKLLPAMERAQTDIRRLEGEDVDNMPD